MKTTIWLSMAVIAFHLSAAPTEINLINYPLVIIPGSGGNQLEARLTAKYKPSSLLCRWYPLKRDSDGWFRLWFDPSVLFKPLLECFCERMMIYYDHENDDYYNAPGVETRVPQFGSTDSLLYLNPNLKQASTYMAQLVKSLQKIGYADGKNVFGAPFDFRYGLAPEGHPSHVGSKFLEDLKNLIESASNSNGGQPVILLSHSLGGLFVLHLLNRNSVSWRQEYVKHFLALSVPWGGTVDEMRTFASGSAFGVPLVDPLLVRAEQRSSATNLWLLPSPKVFDKFKPLVVTANSSYNVGDISQFLQDIGFFEGVHPYKTRVLPLVNTLVAPLVPVTCIVGSGIDTPEMIFYRDSNFNKSPEVVYGDGDGTVNMISLLALESEWDGVKNQVLKVIKIPGMSHTSILSDDTSLSQIIEEICSINRQISSSLVPSNNL